ncbi:sugar phosphate isomerase/epimerase [Bradyrhizobium jicamae]|uniref:sugar phosphate isomerase/epimerase family protein n=1 Tax=Bradyrhizobium jicamae TaxID=280332 RepID=UPI001BA9CA4B|nr:sugar phosphate isomerase/epimerase [Bradyrhizobium jicamae]
MTRSYAVGHLQMLPLDPPDFIEAAGRCGYDAVGLRLLPLTAEERLYPITTDKALLRATQERLAASNVACADVEIVRLTPDVEPESYQAFLETGAALGARTVTTHLPDPETGRAIDKFGRLCAMARPLGLHVGIEFLPWSEVPNLGAAARICKAVAADNCGILVDTLHFHRSASTVAELESLPKSWLRVLHIADCPAETPATAEGLMYTARRERLLPGEGAIDFAPIIAAMPQDIPITLEIPHARRTAEMGLEAYSRKALDVTRAYVEGLQMKGRSNVR